MLRDQLNDALKTALRDKDKRRLATLRLILAAVKDRDISHRGEGKEPVDDAGIIEILGRMIKQRRESITAYEEGGRLELAEQEREEIEVIEEYLPPQLSEEEAEAACREAVAELEAESLRDMGRVMAFLKEKYAGRMDFARTGGAVRKLLT
ncbi:MAG: GatB/YqeY domain-containing protein [Sphingomonadales bacterium]